MFIRRHEAGRHAPRRKRFEEESIVANEDRLRELEEKYEDYKVYDNQGSRIGKVDDLFIDEEDHEEYIGVKMGLFGMRSTLIPMELVRVNEQDRSIEVSETKDHVKDAPNFDDDDDITSEFEERIRTHFGLGSSDPSSRGGYGAASTGATGAAAGAATGETRDREPAQSEGADEHSASDSGDAEHRSSGETRGVDATSATGGSDHDEHATGSSRPDGEDSEGRADSPASGSGAAEYQDYDHARDSESEGPASGEADAQNASQTRQTEETETFEEGGRAKIRRRTIHEEVEDADQDAGRRG